MTSSSSLSSSSFESNKINADADKVRDVVDSIINKIMIIAVDEAKKNVKAAVALLGVGKIMEIAEAGVVTQQDKKKIEQLLGKRSRVTIDLSQEDDAEEDDSKGLNEDKRRRVDGNIDRVWVQGKGHPIKWLVGLGGVQAKHNGTWYGVEVLQHIIAESGTPKIQVRFFEDQTTLWIENENVEEDIKVQVSPIAQLGSVVRIKKEKFDQTLAKKNEEMQEVKEDLEDTDELAKQQTLFVDFWQGKFDQLADVALKAGASASVVMAIRDKKYGEK